MQTTATTATRTDASSLPGPALAESLRRREEQTIALLWEELARTDPALFATLWRKAHAA